MERAHEDGGDRGLATEKVDCVKTQTPTDQVTRDV